MGVSQSGRPSKPAQCEALRGGKQCPNEARAYRPEFDRWVCTTHLLASHLSIQFVDLLPEIAFP